MDLNTRLPNRNVGGRPYHQLELPTFASPRVACRVASGGSSFHRKHLLVVGTSCHVTIATIFVRLHRRLLDPRLVTAM